MAVMIKFPERNVKVGFCRDLTRFFDMPWLVGYFDRMQENSTQPIKKQFWTTKHFILVMSAFFFLGSAVATYFMAFVETPVWYDWILNGKNVQTTGTPVGVRETEVALSENGESQNDPIQAIVEEVTVQFTDAQGKTHVSSFKTPMRAILSQAKTGQPLQIEYSPDHPDIIRVVGVPASFNGPAIFVPGGMAVLSFLVFVVGLFLRNVQPPLED